jgi:hypothetical protein
MGDSMIMHLFRSLRPRKALILAGATLVAAHAMPLHAFSLRDPKTAALTALAVHLLVLHGRKPSARFKRNYNIEDIVRIDQALSADHWKNYLKNWFFLYYNGFIGQLEDENVEEEDENGKTIKCHAQGLLGNVISGIEPYKKACESLGFLLIVHNAIKQEEAGVETVIKAVAAA